MFKATINTSKLITENKDRQSHYWFGGPVVRFKSDKMPEYIFELGAYGDVKATLINKLTNEEIVSVKDKRNSASFYDKMRGYIKNDEELYQLLDQEHETYTLDIANNNWWECYGVNRQTREIVELDNILNADLLSEAIDEAIYSEEDFFELINSIEK